MPPADPAAIATVRAYESSGAAQWPIGSLDPTDEQSAFELLAREFVRLLDAGELVRVKGLMWQKFSNESWHSPTIFGSANVWASEDGSNDYCWSMDRTMGHCESIADGKSKVEAAYRSRLAAALEPLLPEVRR